MYIVLPLLHFIYRLCDEILNPLFKNFYFKKYGEIRITRVENSGI